MGNIFRRKVEGGRPRMLNWQLLNLKTQFYEILGPDYPYCVVWEFRKRIYTRRMEWLMSIDI